MLAISKLMVVVGTLAVVVLNGFASFGQSLISDLGVDGQQLARPGFVGLQEQGYHISYEVATTNYGVPSLLSKNSENWGAHLNRRLPGTQTSIRRIMMSYEQQGALPEDRELQFYQLSNKRESLIWPEGFFVTDASSLIPCLAGQILTRQPLRNYVEQSFAPSTDPRRIVHLVNRHSSLNLSISTADALSVSRLLHQIPAIGIESDWQLFSIIAIQRSNSTGNSQTIFLPTLYERNSSENYYDAFHNLPLADSDTIYLLDQQSYRAMLHSFTILSSTSNPSLPSSSSQLASTEKTNKKDEHRKKLHHPHLKRKLGL